MITREELSKDLVIESLYSRTCPACGDRKREERTLCYDCWSKLPHTLMKPLYQRVGHGYEEALVDALNFLQAESFHTERPR